MQYRVNPKNGDRISALGYGGMRFHKDEQEVERHIRYAIEQGVNYFDTAYIYSGSEAMLGRILSKDGLRDRIKLATKLPLHLVRRQADFDRLFTTQLERLQTDRMDYYLMHMLPGPASWRRLTELGIIEWIAEKKRQARIVNIGFSFHGTKEDFCALLELYDWDFCMIQYNYLDEHNQAGKDGLLYAASKGIPVVVMEPLRGGTLVNKLPPEAKAVWDGAPAKRSYAEWGLRWVLNHPQVLCLLSGMGAMDMVEENVRTVSDSFPNTLSDAELSLYSAALAKIREATNVACTGCGYCMPCPKGVDIPACFSSLNDVAVKGLFQSMYWYTVTAGKHAASRCAQCGQCEKHCPQAIPIRQKLQQVQNELERFPYGIVRFVLSRVLRLG